MTKEKQNYKSYSALTTSITSRRMHYSEGFFPRSLPGLGGEIGAAQHIPPDATGSTLDNLSRVRRSRDAPAAAINRTLVHAISHFRRWLRIERR